MFTTMAVELRELGKTGIRVSPVGLGVMEFAGGGTEWGSVIGQMFPVISQADKNAIIQAALDGGINWFDTAEMYGLGQSERTLAAALHAAGKTNDDVVIATKWVPMLRTARNIPQTIDYRIRYLDDYRIGLYYVHMPFGLSSHEKEMDAMADLVAAGRIRSVGVSNFDEQAMRRAHAALAKRGLPLAANQVSYSLLDRHIERNGVLQAAKELGITIVAHTPLAGGLLTGKYHRDPELFEQQPLWRRLRFQHDYAAARPVIAQMARYADKYNVTIAQVALNWIINANGDTVVVIPGATKVRQAAESAAAMCFKLTPDELMCLSEMGQRK